MPENVTLWLRNAEMTRRAGASIADTLYVAPLTLWLTGDLGSGKTTLLQGFAEALGVERPVTSPTFALEQRYRSEQHGELLHVDLYRLDPRHASHLVLASDEHPAIRCIEWADRLSGAPADGIGISLEENPPREGRKLTVTFRDIAIPSDGEIADWRTAVCLPRMVVLHCEAVADCAARLGRTLLERGRVVRLQALRSAGALHDLLRFVDFHQGTSHIEREINPEHASVWRKMKERYAGLRHEAAAARFIAERGFPHVAEIVRVHGLTLAGLNRVTIEQKLLYYADKRVKLDEIVPLEERLRDFTQRYSRNGVLTESDAWYQEARRTERELFPEGPPF